MHRNGPEGTQLPKEGRSSRKYAGRRAGRRGGGPRHLLTVWLRAVPGPRPPPPSLAHLELPCRATPTGSVR